MNCIWCKNTVEGSVPEHIIPEPLGCPENFVLNNNEICTSCNNNLGHIDQALIDEFDVLVFNQGIRRKKNKKPVVTNRGNVLGKYTKEGKFLFINMENHPVISPFGDIIPAFKNSKRNLNGKLTVNEKQGEVNFKMEMGSSSKFIRGLYKIGFESMVFRFGVEEALQSKYDSVREYVMKGITKRKVIVSHSEEPDYKNELYNFWKTENESYIASFRLAYYDFIVDLSSDMCAANKLENEIITNSWQNTYSIINK